MKKKPVTKQQEMKARAIVQAAMDQQQQAEVERKRQLIGRCYRYRNRFSDGEQWWLYAVVIGVDEHGQLRTAQFQHDSKGRLELSTNHYPGLLPNGGWTPMTPGDFKAAAFGFASVFLRAMDSAMTQVAVDPQAISTGNPSTREG